MGLGIAESEMMEVWFLHSEVRRKLVTRTECVSVGVMRMLSQLFVLKEGEPRFRKSSLSTAGSIHHLKIDMLSKTVYESFFLFIRINSLFF